MLPNSTDDACVGERQHSKSFDMILAGLQRNRARLNCWLTSRNSFTHSHQITSNGGITQIKLPRARRDTHNISRCDKSTLKTSSNDSLAYLVQHILFNISYSCLQWASEIVSICIDIGVREGWQGQRCTHTSTCGEVRGHEQYIPRCVHGWVTWQRFAWKDRHMGNNRVSAMLWSGKSRNERTRTSAETPVSTMVVNLR